MQADGSTFGCATAPPPSVTSEIAWHGQRSLQSVQASPAVVLQFARVHSATPIRTRALSAGRKRSSADAGQASAQRAQDGSQAPRAKSSFGIIAPESP